jgi:predicted lysophospholipase L1 biosynthesis ABC-type transport system permease subunit
MARDWNADSTVISLQRDLVGEVRGKLMILLTAVTMMLLIACTNVASLLLARATTRRKEMALRAALGEGRQRIIRQLLTESMALALAGAVSGMALGMGALSIFKSLLPSSTPGLAEAAIDWPVVCAVTVLTFFTGFAFGLSPALSASQIDLTETIKTGSQRSAGSFWTRLRSFLVTGEVALTVILMVSAGLLLKSLYELSEINPGFDPAHIVTARISPDQSSCAQQLACIALYERLVERARSLSGVASVAHDRELSL